MKPDDKIKRDWRNSGFDEKLNRTVVNQPEKPDYQSGIKFDALLDEMIFNRMLRLKNLPTQPQGNEPGKIYWDQVNKKYKIWIDTVGQWADVVYTTTSTTTSSSSSSSSSSSTSTT